MRKLLVVLMVVMLGVAVLGLVGCGGDTEQAKEYMESADAGWAAIDKDLEELNESLNAMLGGAAVGDYSKVTAESIQSAIDEIDKLHGKIPPILQQYKDITELNGVEDYVSYADKMIQGINASVDAIDGANDMLNKLLPLVQAGDSAGIAAFFEQNMKGMMTLQETGEQADKYFEEAESVKKEKNLGE